ncbi:hypothetical protein [Xiamenia xianingshaonis]|uniref:SCP domain-containing protein n=1 Tax=Xiamenia xianingshaonis TaxID=2682776 RepID=A0A9E6MQ02_9ACTN|nr:hypothetical protein [Xiamenia xianingshaonis]NHM14074.1 hypothetical protein [Xiamenia xianingshaonis]QTU83938.1 hypothetical protein J7S26_06100 [Xiamenia xianingshaonis]
MQNLRCAAKRWCFACLAAVALSFAAAGAASAAEAPDAAADQAQNEVVAVAGSEAADAALAASGEASDATSPAAGDSTQDKPAAGDSAEPAEPAKPAEPVKPGVAAHTQQEIAKYFRDNGIALNVDMGFSTAPSVTKPLSPGSLDPATLNNAVKLVNFCRYVAGLNDDVSLDGGYNAEAQATALLMAVLNDPFASESPVVPGKPADMSDELYELAITDWRLGNRASGSDNFENLQEVILQGWMYDSSNGDVETLLNHRRWLLNPSMGKIGFGAVDTPKGQRAHWFAMSATDRSRRGSEINVAWPAQCTPTELFAPGSAWSLSVGKTIADEDVAAVRVTVKNKKTGKTWNLSSKGGDGELHVDSQGFGQRGCIIFSPRGLKVAEGDAYSVSVTGIEQPVEYDVSFFGLCAPITKVVPSPKSFTYNGKAQTPRVTVAAGSKVLKAGADYRVKYPGSSVNAGVYQVTVIGMGNYDGKVRAEYRINPQSLTKATITGINKTYAYTGRDIAPEPKVVVGGTTLVKGRDYTVAYSNNRGSATRNTVAICQITGKGNYGGTVRITYTIKGSSANGGSSSASSGTTPPPPTSYTPTTKPSTKPSSSNKPAVGWNVTNGKWWYRNADNTYPANCWKKIGGVWYHFDGKGYMQTGWLYDGGAWYYLASSGAMQTGWQKIGGAWYYFNGSGVMQTGWTRVGASWYHLKSSGAMQTGWYRENDKWYYLKPSGVMAVGWSNANNQWYFHDGSGVMKTGWFKQGVKWYYLNASGVMKTGWLWEGNQTYYFDGSGVMARGWTWIGNSWYHFELSGALSRNKWIGDYYVYQSGVMAINTTVEGHKIGADGKRVKA